jgi:hypothetical protein
MVSDTDGKIVPPEVWGAVRGLTDDMISTQLLGDLSPMEIVVYDQLVGCLLGINTSWVRGSLPASPIYNS